ncbi:MAG: DUF1818 family protein [Cyanothece sp. SIO1E1]|nr:DUF1818 family protein [Cyanothece sp. SIO1E1]
MSRQVKSGPGWRLGWDAEAPECKGLIGNDTWSLELTEAELEDLCRLATQLAKTMAQMASQLMEAEKITCEAESDLIWLEVEGFPDAYGLRFILLTGRRGEGGWPAETVPELLQAMQVLKVF